MKLLFCYMWSTQLTKHCCFRGYRLTPDVVTNEVELLQRYTNLRNGKLLEKIIYTSNIVFKNGCRAPTLRQLEGEICYLEIITLEQDEICVTASTSGFFQNQVIQNQVIRVIQNQICYLETQWIISLETLVEKSNWDFSSMAKVRVWIHFQFVFQSFECIRISKLQTSSNWKRRFMLIVTV